jgi:hypothetical protein
MASSHGQDELVIHPSRHQLDELDALMERMLALPVNPPDDWQAYVEKPKPTKSAIPEEFAEFSPISSAVIVHPRHEVEEPELAPLETAPDLPTEKKVFTGAETESTLPSEPPLPVVLQPVLWLDRAFVWTLDWFGPPGRWLSGPAGRNFLAWSGVFLMLAALLWIIADGLGLDLTQTNR